MLRVQFSIVFVIILLDLFLLLVLILLLLLFLRFAKAFSLHVVKLLRLGNLGESLWMSLEEYLTRCLAKLCDLHFEGISLHGVLKCLNINSPLIGHWMEHIQVFY